MSSQNDGDGCQYDGDGRQNHGLGRQNDDPSRAWQYARDKLENIKRRNLNPEIGTPTGGRRSGALGRD
jgi:hypothetical protein